MPGSLSTRTINTSATNRQSPTFDSSSSSLLPDTANIVVNPSADAATLAQQRVKLKAPGNAAHRISAPALASSGERGIWTGVLGQVAEQDNFPTQEISVGPRSSRLQSTDFSGFSAGSAFRTPHPDCGTIPGPLDKLSPVVGDTCKHDEHAAPTYVPQNLNDLYGSSNVPRLDGPDPSRATHDISSGSNYGVTNNGVYGDNGDHIQGHHAPGVGRVQGFSSRGLRNGGGGTWSGGQRPALSNTSGRFGGRNDGSNVIAAALRQAALAGLGMGVGGFNLGLGSPGLAGMSNGLNMAQLAQLNGINGMNSFNMNMNMLNLAAMGVSPEAQLLAAQIAAAGGGFGQPGLGVGAGLGTFRVGGMQGGMGSNGLRGGFGRSGGRSPGLGGGSGQRRIGRERRSEEGRGRFRAVGAERRGRVAAHAPATQVHADFRGHDVERYGGGGRAGTRGARRALGARRKMLKTFEMVRKKMGIDDPSAPPPPSGGSSGGSAGSGGGLSA
ncbi:hypothetical protein EDB85DRAFT_2297400 [Lactarius pseudohatsudake]|nr:hypothetical protein EDB85DRAFT_2297400 [Lactarius pseudohatsudake]